ncbi:MAG: hypothetical protein KAZ56_03345 [Candidatus Microthrix sp.]|uniref:hypothetical protein n=1 Tax=Candidatus Neomicrothrix sp. TaxID=2719034 RepID=UPI001B5417DE|nr:hypothetical protein [Candidatus Microthrix sp.]MBP7993570.1 hypothetical protein [Candidatus Microthrix sp.]
MNDTIEPSLSPAPTIVGVATAVGRPGDHEAPDAVGWMERALVGALDDAAGPGGSARVELAAEVGWVGVAEGTWRCSDAGAVLAERLGLGAGGPVHTVRADIGILQQRLIAEACGAILRGEVEAAVVVGGEARARDRAIARRGGVPTETAGPEGAQPDEVIHPAADLMSDLELERDLATPATQYAIIEDALAGADGIDRAALRRRLGDLWAGFAAVAADNPTAWDRSEPPSRAIVSTEGGNRMVADPYTRSLCSQWNVDSASALVLVSTGLAERLRIPPRRRVTVEATAESNLIVPLPQRAAPHRWPAFENVVEALAAHLGVQVEEGLGAELVDLYACFPSAVQVQARALGLPLDATRLTVTGGMTFAGGPLNNAMLASVVAMAQRLRRLETNDGSARGLVTSISGMLTKPGAMMLRIGRDEPGVPGHGLPDTGVNTAGAPAPFVALDVTEESSRHTEAVDVDANLTGRATVVGATVIPTFEGHDRVVAVLRTPPVGGPVFHTVATSDAEADAVRVRAFGGAGATAHLDGQGGFTLLEA